MQRYKYIVYSGNNPQLIKVTMQKRGNWDEVTAHAPSLGCCPSPAACGPALSAFEAFGPTRAAHMGHTWGTRGAHKAAYMIARASRR